MLAEYGYQREKAKFSCFRNVPHLRNPVSRIFGSGIWNPGYFCPWNLGSRALEYGIQPKEYRIQVQLTKTGIKYLDSGI